MKFKLIFLISLLLLGYGCGKKATGPDDNSEMLLTDEEQLTIVAAEVAADNGGVMTEVSMAASIAKGGYGGLAKPSSYDTTFTRGWITYSVSLSFYTAQGIEQVFYVPNVTDKIIYDGTLTGKRTSTNPDMEIDLNKNASLVITGITSGVLTINGTATNNSSYKFSGKRANIEAQVQSSYVLTNVVIDKNSNSYVPQSGKIECTFDGTYSKDGVIQAKDVEYNFTVTLEFTGGTQVKVTLPNGNQFTLDIITGDFS